MVSAVGLATLLVLFFPPNAGPYGAGNSETPPNEFVRGILENEARAEAQDHSHWSLKVESDTPQGKAVDRVVETKYGDLKRHLIVAGRPLTPAQERAEDERIQHLAHHPDALRKSMKGENEDSDRSQRMLKMLPDALIFSYGEHRGDAVQLYFKSNPKFRPPSHEAQVFQALEGDLWVDTKQARLIALSGRLDREVKFGGGWLGHLNQGGRFEVKQAEVAPGYWELTLLDVNMKGKALFFKTIHVQENIRRSDFQKISDDLTLAQAVELLRKQTVVAQGTERTQR